MIGKALQINRITLNYEDLPDKFDGFTILHLTDLHTTKWGRLEERLRAILKNNSVDLVVFTGDFASNEHGLEPFCNLLRTANGKYGVYIAFGNTEHKHWKSSDLISIFEATGAKVLKNTSVAIEKEGQFIELVGVDDPFMGHARLSKALRDVPADRFKILLAHSPSITGEAAERGVSLLLSGHTHGGQVRLPVIGAIKTHLPHDYRPLAMGLFEGERLSQILKRDAGNLKVYVSRGIGTSYLPIRLLCPPEIPLYTLKKR